ncbi:radial spoke head protein 6 homolog A-like, partial [Limulus polyphemus]|uniref:Radial spoke head protein 6 homolog A-like n=1 Tax=Limulus polyphemus TaxID=6850 RepID=A0ABM1BLZ7_LIMPO
PSGEPTEVILFGKNENCNIVDVTKSLHVFEQVGVGLNQNEVFQIALALEKLGASHPLEKIRFWGKILGTKRNYIVAETCYIEGAEEEEEEEEEEIMKEEEKQQQDREGKSGEEDKPPYPSFKPPPLIPSEDVGTGTNKFTYFICSKPGDEWIRLPKVTPLQIVVARQIKKYLTGHLDAQVSSYPPFPGNEGNYLRAQIARISAGTHVSPIGYYQFEEDEEEEEDEEGKNRIIENSEYEPISLEDLISQELSSWVHHAQHILPQGRCTRYMSEKRDGKNSEESEGEESEELEESDSSEREIGPPLLTPLSEDVALDRTPPWTPYLSSRLLPTSAVAVLRSNLWPGAYTISDGKTFENVYIGFGHKYSVIPCNPSLPPTPQEEYPSGPEITEIEDPRPEEEEELKEALEEEQEGEPSEEMEESEEENEEN